jgi:hypothetical protein
MWPVMWLECSARQRLVPTSETNVATSLPSQSARSPVFGSSARKSRLRNAPAVASGRLEWQRAQVSANTMRPRATAPVPNCFSRSAVRSSGE